MKDIVIIKKDIDTIKRMLKETFAITEWLAEDIKTRPDEDIRRITLANLELIAEEILCMHGILDCLTKEQQWHLLKT